MCELVFMVVCMLGMRLVTGEEVGLMVGLFELEVGLEVELEVELEFGLGLEVVLEVGLFCFNVRNSARNASISDDMAAFAVLRFSISLRTDACDIRWAYSHYQRNYH